MAILFQLLLPLVHGEHGRERGPGAPCGASCVDRHDAPGLPPAEGPATPAHDADQCGICQFLHHGGLAMVELPAHLPLIGATIVERLAFVAERGPAPCRQRPSAVPRGPPSAA